MQIPSNVTPIDSVAVIIYFENNDLLMQLRDKKSGIFYPNYWCLFGGAIENNETPLKAISREIKEEISIKKNNFKFFSDLILDFSCLGHRSNVLRKYFLLKISDDDFKNINLNEGQNYRIFSREEIDRICKIMPFDKFIIDLFFKKFDK